MNVFFLGGNVAKSLAKWLSAREEVFYTEKEIDIKDVKSFNPDFIVSYNYRYIIPKEIIKFVKGKAINLHISYLPWNKGSHPNLWSFLDDTPKGITIHYINEKIDGGDIIVQKKIHINEEKETLQSSYDKLHIEMQNLFKKYWTKIRNGEIKAKRQKKGGTIHYKKEFEIFKQFISKKSWNLPIKEFKEYFSKKLNKYV